jgi:hypothetical protein
MMQFANATRCTFWWGLILVNAECLMTNGMARTELCRNRARTTIAARGTREMVVVVVVVVCRDQVDYPLNIHSMCAGVRQMSD